MAGNLMNVLNVYTETVEVSTSHLPNGVYFIQYSQPGHKKLIKVIVLH
jgi:hypothetical protein